uniref:LysR family transcriptional regulator n=1 Tax=Ruminococcus sp. TaxID=41978 RepID=UPI00338DEABA|nr:LysR family transcriptional regulator [Ruminococcus sp.]
MNTEYYRILLRTVEIGNITKAAELLGYTQSGISRIIGKLEEELGTPIVTRNRTGIELR